MKIHYFHVETQEENIKQVLARIDNLNSIEKEKEIDNKIMFLESFKTDQKFLYTDFTQRRMKHGPGYSQKGQATEDFNLGEDAGFGEQTAVVWSLNGDYIAIQYNHYGPKPGTISEYLSSFVEKKTDEAQPLDFIPVISDNIWAKLQNSKAQVKLECSVFAENLTNEMINNNVPISSMLRLANETSAGKIDFTLSYGSTRRAGPLKRIPEICEAMLKAKPDKLKVGIKNELDAQIEMLDLLQHRAMEEVPSHELKLTPGLRWDVNSRFDTIKLRLAKWLEVRSCI